MDLEKFKQFLKTALGQRLRKDLEAHAPRPLTDEEAWVMYKEYQKNKIFPE